MELDYSGAEDLSAKRAIHKAYWDHIRNRLIETDAQPVSREDFLRISREIAENNRKKKQQQEGKDNDIPPPA
jgi:hypothetical protein